MDFHFESFPEFFRLCVFKICSHIFMIFEVKLSSDFCHAETGSGAKTVKLFRSKFQVE